MALKLEDFEGLAPPPAPEPLGFAPAGGFDSFPPAGDFGGFAPAAPPMGGFDLPLGAPAAGGSGPDYDAGYKAGWEDAEKRDEADARRLSEALLHSVQDLTFTLHEARVHVLKLVRPLVEAMISSLVPQVAEASLPMIVAEEIEKIAMDLAEEPLVLRICNDDRMALERALSEAQATLRVKLVAEPSLVQGQVLISTESFEKRVDLDEVRTRVILSLRTLTSDLQTFNEPKVA
jgi:hypothetical protein